LLASLNAAGVQVKCVRSPDKSTGCAFICVANNADNAITVAPGANLSLGAEHLPDLRHYSHLLMQLEIALPTVTAYALAARQQDIKVVLNAAPAQALPAELLATVDVLIVNEGELTALMPQPMSLVTNLAQLPVPCVVVTLGQRGCVARLGNNFFVQAAYPVNAVDSTGAGDTFCGVLVAALDRSEPLPEALRLASAAAALACTRPGAQASIPNAAEVQAFLAEHPDNNSDLLELRRYCGFS
jgi:ribokinase